MRVSVIATAVLTLAILGTASSNAALVACPADFTADGTAKVHDGSGLSAASACQYIDPPDNSTVANPSNVNNAGGPGIGFFDFADWEINGDNSQLSVEALSGTWAIQSVNFDEFDYMLTFKDGAGTNLISFLLNEVYSSGVWDSPFTSAAFTALKPGQTKEVSHFSIFQRLDEEGGGGGGDPVPEPGSLALIGSAMLGLYLARRRRRS